MDAEKRRDLWVTPFSAANSYLSLLSLDAVGFAPTASKVLECYGIVFRRFSLQTEKSAFLLPRGQNLRRYIQRISLHIGLLEIELTFRCFDKMHPHLSFAESVF